MAPVVWSWHMVVENMVATVGSTDSSCDALVQGLSSSIWGDLPVVRDLAISWNPGGSTFELAPRSSFSWGTGSRELPDEAELKGSLRACCSSSRRHQALFHWLEIQLQWCHLRSPRLQGILCTEAAIQDKCTFTHLGYSDSMGPLASPVVFWRGGSIGWLICQCSSDMGNWLLLRCGGVAIRVADMFSSTDSAMAKTVGLSTAWGSMGLGWVVSSTSTSGNPCTRPSKTSWSLKVVYLIICHLNSCVLIAKQWGSPGTGGLAFSAQYWRACA